MADPHSFVPMPASAGTDPEADASFHVVPFPAEARFATISCYTTNGLIRITTAADVAPTTLAIAPDSPIYNLKNPACAGNVVVPLANAGGKPIVVAVTFCNDCQPDPAPDDKGGTICVLVGLSFPPPDKQMRLVVKRLLKSKNATLVHIVFSPV